jgi:hypothetical protein
MRWTLLILIVLLVGCGPTHTAGTKGKSAKELAVLSIDQLDAIPGMEIQSIRFDDHEDAYKVGDGREFYLLPGEHTASFDFKVEVKGPPGWFIPSKALTVPGPKGVPLGVMSAGKMYEMNGLVEGFEHLVRNGEFNLIREKPKPLK